MRKWSTKSGYEIYQVLTGRCNSYLICTKNQTLLVDTGKSSAYKKLISNIDMVGLSKISEPILILTHTHFDHCQNAWALSNHHNFKIISSELEVGFAKNGFSDLPRGTNLLSNFIVTLGEKYLAFKFGFRPFNPDFLVKSDETFSFDGLNIYLLNTPGHSVGSISVVVDDEIVLVGDAMFGIFPNSVFPPFADNEKELIQSWGKLLQTNCRLFLPAHGRPVSLELLQKEYQKHSK